MHGRRRDADRYLDQWAAYAEELGVILVVPEFDSAQFPGEAYILGGLRDGAGGGGLGERVSFSAIEPLFDTVRARTGTRVERYDLYGHSAGAQFVHRFVMFMPATRLGRAVAANAGWYTMPDAGASFPYGLSGAGVSDDDLARALQRPLVILLGTADTDPQHPSLRRTPEAMKQGPHRLARGETFMARAGAAAVRLGVETRWNLAYVAGSAHDNATMTPEAARILAAPAPRGPSPK